jgi:hypothetical protein
MGWGASTGTGTLPTVQPKINPTFDALKLDVNVAFAITIIKHEIRNNNTCLFYRIAALLVDVVICPALSSPSAHYPHSQ